MVLETRIQANLVKTLAKAVATELKKSSPKTGAKKGSSRKKGLRAR